MADPQHQPVMDGFDRTTVTLYRTGLLVVGVSLLGMVITSWIALEALAWLERGVLLGTALAAANMHLYDKRIRWIIGGAGWLGLVLVTIAALLPPTPAHLVHYAGMGFAFVALSGFAIKEQFCFKIPGLRLVPLFLAASLVPLVLGEPHVASLLLLPAGVLYVVLTVAKLRMPMGHDIGNKANYQV